MSYSLETRWLAVQRPNHRFRALLGWASPWWDVPSITWRNETDAVVYALAVPGHGRDDLTIDVQGQTVTVRGERAFERGSNSSFSTSFSLPDSLDPDDVSADLADGLLTLRFAKRPQARARRVPVRVIGALPAPTLASERGARRSSWDRARDWLRRR